MMLINRTEYNSFTGCPVASLLLERVRWWFKHTGRHFYKFNAPCNATEYRAGDSWTEELNISYHQFTSARAKIATRVRKGDSMTDLKSVFKADGSLQPATRIVLYYQDKRRRLWYWLNEALLEAWIAETATHTAPDPQIPDPIYDVESRDPISNHENRDPIYDPQSRDPIYSDKTYINNKQIKQTEQHHHREGTERRTLPPPLTRHNNDDDDVISLSDSGIHEPGKPKEPEQPTSEPTQDMTPQESILRMIGVHEPHCTEFNHVRADDIRHWRTVAENFQAHNIAGFVLSRLRAGATPPPNSAPPPAPRDRDEERLSRAVGDYWQKNPVHGGSGKRFVSGRYADHVDH